MSLFVKLSIIIWLIPVCLFALLALTHKRGPMPFLRDKLATGGMGVCLALALYMLKLAWGGKTLPTAGHSWSFNWLSFSAGKPIAVGILVDNLTVIMLVVVTLVSFLVHLFSIGYMKGDVRYGRYYCGLLIFSASMLGLVLADNLLFLYIFWELVGLSSYLLIGHWYEKKSAADAAMKAFITTRIGDVGMFLGILVIYSQVGSFAYSDVFAAVANGTLGGHLRMLAGLGLFFGAMGKSAQFPLHVWLPDAMEGPTPVSALIHAATMVAAGVYLVGRLYLVFDPPTLLVIAYVGALTAFIAATIALVQDDIKKVLAYSTVSQLGYMMLGLGVGGYTAGLFHLTTHACFKACLFLGSGSVIYAMHHEQSMSQYGGLFAKMKITAITFLVSCMAISGVPWITSGFYSKDLILGDTLAFYLRDGHAKHLFLPLAGFGTALMTAFYMFRQYYLTFTGKPRNQEKFHHAHESPWMMTVPLVILGTLAIVAGGFRFGGVNVEWFQPMVHKPAFANYAKAPSHEAPSGEGLNAAATAHGEGGEAVAGEGAGAEGEHEDPLIEHAHEQAMTLSIIVALSGILLATLMYYKGLTWLPARLAKAAGPLYTFLWNKWYFDELYHATLVAGTRGASALAWAFDRYVIDFIVNVTALIGRISAWVVGLFDNVVVDGAVNGAAATSYAAAERLARTQGGRLRGYLLILIIGMMTVMAVFAATFLHRM